MLLLDAKCLSMPSTKARANRPPRDWLREALLDSEAVAFAWTVVLALLRLSTHPAVFPHPLNVDQAADWLTNCPTCSKVRPQK